MHSVRPATRKDLPSIFELEKQFGDDAFSETSLRGFIGGNNLFMVVEVDKKVVGYSLTLFRKNSKKVRVYSIIMDKDFQNNGYASDLLFHNVMEARARMKNMITLEVSENNPSAIQFYKKIGFEQFGREEGYYADGSAALKMCMDL
jgi:ribosomal protein S18 acetylase RimI-like enzyme